MALAAAWAVMDDAGGPFTSMSIDNELKDWPDRQPEQVRWLYVGTLAEHRAEAVILIIGRRDDGELDLASVEFGRP